MPPPSRRALLVPSLILVIAVLAVFAPVAADRFIADRDLPRFTYEDRALWANRVAAGELPEWNPQIGVGVPLLAAPVHGTYYAPNLVLLLGDGPTWLSLLFAAHVVLAGFGGLVLARRLGCRPATATVAGLAFAIGGYSLSMLGNGEKVLSGAWLPWTAVGLIAATRAPRGGAAIPIVGAAGAFAMMALAGDPFLWLDAALLGVPLSLAAGERSRRTLVRLAVIGGLALALAAPAIVPALAYVDASERAGGMARALAEKWSMAPSDLLGLVVPGYEHSVDPEFGSHWAMSLYLGVGALAALAAGRRRVSLTLWAVVAGSALLAMGEYTPVHALVRRVFPPLAYTRYPEKHAMVLCGALALLAALGWERLVHAAEGRWPTRVARALWIVPIATALDLFVATAPRVSWLDADQLRLPPPLARAIDRSGQVPRRVFRRNELGPSLETLVNNDGVQFGLAALPGHDPAQPGRFYELSAALKTQEVWDRRFRIDARIETVGDRDQLVPIARPAPRAVVIGHVRVADDKDALDALASTDFDDTVQAVVAPGAAARALVGDGAAGSCEIVRYRPEHVELDCTATSEALVVLSDAHVPGWRAAVDGAAVPVVRADYLMRGVYIAPGRHAITMRFATPGRDAGLALGAVGLAICGVMAGGSWRRRRRAMLGS